ncbi:cupin [[Phormidium] sp. ETS-05]|uniref:cysteine dioxygenase family protein n=1 Tax=[Phormidium] sp. ETS-05 TaxID=222819 RepID=UPI0018EEEF09|nr:cupin [[Phormidium] sp. ETS-05]
MAMQDWLVTNEGHCLKLEVVAPAEKLSRPYRLYRFLTDLEDIVETVKDDHERLKLIFPLVRRLLNSSEWLQMNFLPPDPATGWSVLMLYDEPDFPITAQTVVWAPGSISPIHNHGTWGIVALLNGQEKNTLWQRYPTAELPDHIAEVGNIQLQPGDLIGFMPDAIHHVEAIGDDPTISFNLYGETNYPQRFEFDLTQSSAKNF